MLASRLSSIKSPSSELSSSEERVRLRLVASGMALFTFLTRPTSHPSFLATSWSVSSRPNPHRSLPGGPRTSRGNPRTYANDHGPAASPLQNPIRRTLSLRNGPSARSTRRNRSHSRASRLRLVPACRGRPDPASQVSCSIADVLDSLHACGLTLHRRPSAPPVEGGPQPPCVTSASCGRRATVCRERSDWCPYALLPRRWASPPVSPLPP